MIRGFELRETTTILRPILELWLTDFEKACMAFPQTERAWFIENTLASLFSSASWQAGFTSIVEAKAERSGKKDPKLDILIKGENTCLAMEAKIHFIAEEGLANRINERLAEALQDASNVTHSEASRYFGLVFALMDDSVPGADLRSVLTATVEKVKERHPTIDAVAWILLDQPTAIYRGCVLACKEVNR